MYKSDKQFGEWNIYSTRGVLEFTYNFTDNKLLYFRPEEPGKEQKYHVLIDNEEKEVILDRTPIYLGGTQELRTALDTEVKIPLDALDSGKSAKVVNRLSINELGEITDYEINNKYGYGLDEEVIRVLKTFKHWLPAVYQGKEIATKFNIPFSLRVSSGKRAK